MEDGARSEAGLPMTGVALIEAAVKQEAVVSPTAFRALKALPPASLEERMSTLSSIPYRSKNWTMERPG